jgi:dihydropteroate synthase
MDAMSDERAPAASHDPVPGAAPAGGVPVPGAAPAAHRMIPTERGVVPGGLDAGGGATSSFAVPDGSRSGVPGVPDPMRIGDRLFTWGTRTHVMGILNVTPDSFSGDGLIADGSHGVGAAVARGRAMAADGAEILDVGGESSRPGHAPVDVDEEIRRIVPVIAALRDALPGIPVSVDTVKPAVAAAAIDAGAALVNDIWGVAEDDRLSRVAAERGVPIILMHNRAEARYTSVVAEVIGDLQRAVDRAMRAGVPWDSIVVDPGFGFGKAPEHNLALLRGLASLRVLGRPILLGTSRKSTLGKVLDLPPEERVEATVATTVLAAAAGVDIVRVHDVRENVRAARMADAVVRGEGPSR